MLSVMNGDVLNLGNLFGLNTEGQISQVTYVKGHFRLTSLVGTLMGPLCGVDLSVSTSDYVSTLTSGDCYYRVSAETP